MQIYMNKLLPLLHHFVFWTFNAIQCGMRFCFQTCLNKRDAGELFCKRNRHKNCLEVSTAQPSEFWTFNAVQCSIRFCFQTCFYKRDAGELFCRGNAGQSHCMPGTLTFCIHLK